MIAQDKTYFKKAASTVYQLSQEELIRMEYETMEDYIRTQRDIQSMLAKLGMQKTELKALADEINRLHA